MQLQNRVTWCEGWALWDLDHDRVCTSCLLACPEDPGELTLDKCSWPATFYRHNISEVRITVSLYLDIVEELCCSLQSPTAYTDRSRLILEFAFSYRAIYLKVAEFSRCTPVMPLDASRACSQASPPTDCFSDWLGLPVAMEETSFMVESLRVSAFPRCLEKRVV